MSGVLGFGIGVAVGAGIMISQAVSYYRSKARLLKRKSEMLNHALTLYKVHLDSLDEFINSAAPDALKDLLMDFSDLVNTERKVQDFFNSLSRFLKEKKDFGPSDATTRDLEQLHDNWPGLAQLFEKVIRTGVFAAVLRWPDATEDAAEALSCLVINPQQQVTGAVRVTEWKHRDALSGMSELVTA